MELNPRNQTVSEVRSTNVKLVWAVLILTVGIVALAIKLVTQTEIIINQTPGMPNHAVIEKGAMDKGAQKATLSAVTAAITQVNPANYEYMKAFVQSFLSPTAYTKVTQEIDARVQMLIRQHELGSYYFVMRGYQYDPVLDHHFVYGDVHTVNAARDSAEPYVFEYLVHVENYRLVVDEVVSYPGERPHDSEWLKTNKR